MNAAALPGSMEVEVSGLAQPATITPVTIVVPCFNEEDGIPYLAQRLDSLVHELDRTCRLSIILVDDGSTDATWDLMERHFGQNPTVTRLRHPRNMGIAAASLAGILASKDEAVAVIDSDCTYDPALIGAMVPLLARDVCAITASPYHAMGGVRGVPRWRIFLSHSASRSYRFLFRNKLSTYTSCFRLYRRDAVAALQLRHSGFIGVTEKLALLDKQGWKIVEVPALLEMRKFGQSKLKITRAVMGHLCLMAEIAAARVMGRWLTVPVDVVDGEIGHS